MSYMNRKSKNITNETFKYRELMITPLEKVLQILENLKLFLKKIENSYNFINQLNWIISVISSHALYSYDISKKNELMEKYKTEMPQIRNIFEYVSKPNENLNIRSTIMMRKKNISSSSQNIEIVPKLQSIRARGKKQMTVSYSKKSPLEDNLMHVAQNPTSNHFLTGRSSLNTPKAPKNLIEKMDMRNERNNSPKSFKSNSGRDEDDYLNFEHDSSMSEIFNNIEEKVYNDNTTPKYINRRSIEGNLFKFNNEFFQPIFNPFYIEKILISAGFNPKNILTFDFNIFELKHLVGYNNVLPVVGKMIFESFGFNDSIINTTKLDSFFSSVTSGYLKNTLYHNALHATDVTQTVATCIINSNFEQIICTNLTDILSLIIAAFGHDLGHPGLTNAFQINTSSDIAITYNDISVLENFHSAILFKILKDEDNNLFLGFSEDYWKLLRKRIIKEILATDMVHHGKILALVNSKISNKKEDQRLINKDSHNLFEDQQTFLNFMIHSADLGHNAKKFKISIVWVELLSNEFWRQGEKEKSLNMPISFLCNRETVDIPNSQIGFIKAFVSPNFEVLVNLFPSLQQLLKNVEDNLQKWTELMEEKRKTGFSPEKKMTIRNNSYYPRFSSGKS